MCEYVTLPLILEIVTEKIKGVIIGFKEFKKLLMRMLHSLSQMENILTLVRLKFIVGTLRIIHL